MFHASVVKKIKIKNCYSISNLGKMSIFRKEECRKTPNHQVAFFFQIHKPSSSREIQYNNFLPNFFKIIFLFFNINQLLRNMIRQ